MKTVALSSRVGGAILNTLFVSANFGRYCGGPFTIGHQQKYRKTGGGLTISPAKSRGLNEWGPSSRKYITVGVSAIIQVLR